MTTIDRFHLSDSMSENAAYQLISSRICERPVRPGPVLCVNVPPFFVFFCG